MQIRQILAEGTAFRRFSVNQNDIIGLSEHIKSMYTGLLVVKRDDENNSSGGTPYLYFIALGLGIVFMNFWVFLGIRHCLRHRRDGYLDSDGNSMTITGPNGEIRSFDTEAGTIFLGLPYSEANRRARVRRKKVKRLMKIELLNEKFPVQKYKTWGSLQESLGKASEGGISASATTGLQPLMSVDSEGGSQSAAADNSDRNSSSNNTSSNTGTSRYNSSSHETSMDSNEELSNEKQPTQYVSHLSDLNDHVDNKHSEHVCVVQSPEEYHEDDKDEADELEETYVPPSALDAPGDTCAICIDTLEPDDDVRALDCNHVFHDECITPWFTTRKACCPLCKRDYCPDPIEQPDSARSTEGGSGHRHNPHSRARSSEYSMIYPHSIITPVNPMAMISGSIGHGHRGSRQTSSSVAANDEHDPAVQETTASLPQRMRASFPMLRFARHGQALRERNDVEAIIQ